jgi:hypothetical protein
VKKKTSSAEDKRRADFDRKMTALDRPIAELNAAIASVPPLPRCEHGNALRDHAGDVLEPSCGCRRYTFEGVVRYEKDDGGSALIADIQKMPYVDKEKGMWVALHSWDRTGKHVDASPLAGKRVRITLEIV